MSLAGTVSTSSAQPSHISRDDLWLRMTTCPRPILVEALGAGHYDDAHLPGAVNIPPGQVDRLAAALLPDRQAPIVVYCSAAGVSSEAVAPRRARLRHRRRVPRR